MRTLLALLCLTLTSCAGYRIAGKIATPWGGLSSDGKTVTVELDTRGLAK